MPDETTSLLSGNGAASAQLTDLYEDTLIASGETTKPLTNLPNAHAPQTGVHLYEFPASFYSCEARLVLEEKGIEYEEHDICIIAGIFDQYEPEYVRINSRCVVPTLVVNGKVTSDAHNIVLNADAFFPQTVKLYPTDETRALVKEQFDLACSIFVEALTYGEIEGVPKLPWMMRGMLKSNHGKKYKALTAKLEEHSDDPYLKACYEGKLAILTKQIEILNDEKQLTDIVDATKIIMGKLNDQLTSGPAKDGTSWLCGKDYTIADMQWGLNLVRLHNRGYDDLMWGEYPAIKNYCERLMSRPSIQKAVISYQKGRRIGGLILRRKLANNGNGVVALAAVAAVIVGLLLIKMG